MKRKSYLILIVLFLSGCSTIPLKERSDYIEKRLYRRMPYKLADDHRIISLFYASSRKIENHQGELEFKPEMSSSLTLGKFNCRIDPLIKIGRVIPGDLRGSGAIGVRDVEKLSDQDFIKALAQAVQSSPHKSLLVLVYGFKDNFELTATKAAYFAYLLDVDTPVILFDWPGDQRVGVLGYKTASEFAVASGPYLGGVLARIIREVKPGKLWIESSSLGCLVVCSAFDWMYQHPDLSDSEPEISHVAMVAPDVSKYKFDLKFRDELAALTDKLTAYVSSNDRALLMAQIIDGEKKFGRQRIKVEEQEQFEEARDLLYLKSLEPDRISIVDVTPINKASYGHGYDLEAPEFYDDFYMRIFDVSAHNNRRLYLVNVDKNIDYWIMRSDW